MVHLHHSLFKSKSWFNYLYTPLFCIRVALLLFTHSNVESFKLPNINGSLLM